MPPSLSAGARLRLALTFLTRLPLPPLPVWPQDGLAQAMPLFPLAGFLIGGGLGLVLLAALQVWPPLLAAVLTLLVGVVLTGGLHEDGLADCADGLGGGPNREKTVTIMRDSRVGTYGVLALLLSVGLRGAALAQCAAMAPGQAVALLVLAHGLGRGVMPLAMTLLPPARPDGLAAAAGRPGQRGLWLQYGQMAAAALLLLPVGRAVVLAVVLTAVLALALRLARQRLGGYTGDVLGALEQLSELCVLLLGAAWL